MYIIERSNGSEAARWNNLHNPNWPDGVSQSGRSKAGDSRVGEDGETYTIKEVLLKTEGDGPRKVSVASVAKVGDEWHQVTTMGAALDPPPDPKPVMTNMITASFAAEITLIWETNLICNSMI